MKLAYWMYAGPAHIGTLRVASSFKNVHAIMHAPLGDDYFNVMRSMLERERDFTPVTASIVDRHVLARGSQSKVVNTMTRKGQEDQSDLILLTPTCTSSILQEDLQSFVDSAQRNTDCDVLLADTNHYRVNELQAADRTLAQVVEYFTEKAKASGDLPEGRSAKPSCNIIGTFTLGFHNQHDCRELRRLLGELGVEVNQVIPEGGDITELKNLSKAWFNLCPYREVGLMSARYLEQEFGMPYVDVTPMGIAGTGQCIKAIEKILNDIDPENKISYDDYIERQAKYVSQAAWFSRSIDCQNLTGKKAVVFGDATHAAAMTRILSREMGIDVVVAGTYCKNEGDWFREQVQNVCGEVLITDDNTQVSDTIARVEPGAVFGTQMERHVGKRLEIPCGVISAPVHIQNFPLGYRPFLGYEGTNNIADLVYNSFALGMEDHLLEIFGGHDTKEAVTQSVSTAEGLAWSEDGLEELQRIPGFVRGRVKRNTEKFARSKGIDSITAEVMYQAKEAAGA